ncbi:probable cytochrome P450 9f2 [Achroia grisella]|uniref:probable cytochrome P450 9f2 n=1 Tax=Achroia grisella TaxID=688607 RepID=UPI0027D2E83B|nr:probable cytochrome P450 9f2 [Achroia grisella]
MFVELLIFLLTFLAAYYIYLYYKAHDYFRKRDIKFLPGVPLFGNSLQSTLLKSHIWEDVDVVYKSFPDEKYVGYIEGTVPVILVREPTLIKAITVKDFDHFVNHKDFFDRDIEPLFAGSLIQMKDDRWRDMRVTLSPAFTGSKMRLMMPFMTEISKNIVEYIKGTENPTNESDVNDLVRRYTVDVIASVGFGLQVNSLKDKNNDFFRLGSNLFKFSYKQWITLLISSHCPIIGKALGLKLFSQETIDFFSNTVKDTISYREKNNVVRPDMLQLLIEATKGILKASSDEKYDAGFAATEEGLKSRNITREWTANEITSQVFIFFAAGFESTAGTIAICLHELALNPEVQEKLYQELRDFKEDHENLTYENLTKLKYLDGVVTETLRKWAVAVLMDRVCTKPYVLPPPREGGKPYQIKAGDIVYNMVNSIHMDEKYYPQPEIFNPDRFSDENKANILPTTYMPFGNGPRNCIGSRFALMQVKVLIYDLILNFRVLKSKKTLDPIRLHHNDFNIKALGGTYLKFEARS